MAPSHASPSAALPHAAIRQHLALLPLYVVGVVLAWQLASLLAPRGLRDAEGLVKGHDFVQFYALGTLAREGRSDLLYDNAAVNRRMWALVPEATGDEFPPLYPPIVALAFAPLSLVPYERALYAWLAFSVLCYGGACALVVSLAGRRLPVPRASLVALLLLSPALNVALVAGQTSGVALLVLCLAWFLFERGRTIETGIALGMLAFKPQLLVGPVAVLVLCREWRVVAGVAGGAVAQLALSWSVTSAAVMAAYAGALAVPIARASIPEPIPEHVHGLAGAWRLLLGQGPPATALFLATGAVAVVVAARAWRRAELPSERFAVLLLVCVLLSPHLYAYDLLLLAPALVVTWAWAERQSPPRRAWGRAAAWAGWVAPLTAPLAIATRIQWSALVLLGLLTLLASVELAPSEAHD